jgi:hypothetical protein
MPVKIMAPHGWDGAIFGVAVFTYDYIGKFK